MNAETACTTQPRRAVFRAAEANSRFTQIHRGFLASVGFAAFLLVSAPALAQLLGNAQSFAILGGSQVTVGGVGATINGNVGVSPGTSITGPVTVVPPFAIHNNDQSAIDARAATLTLYNSLVAMGGATPIPPGLNGQNLGPGLYSTGAALLTNGAPLILTGAGTYIFQITSSLTANVGSSVVLNGVDPCNVFWQVTSLATLNGTTFPGTVVAQTGVHMGTSAILTGRALAAAAGDVTLAGGNTVGGCSGPPITIAPPTVPNGTVGVPYSQQITVSGGTAPITFSVVSGILPVGLTLTAGGLLSGTPTTAGPSTITIRATDVNGHFADITYTIISLSGGGTAIPTLSEWAMIMLAALLAIAGVAAMRRQRNRRALLRSGGRSGGRARG
jgi:hypothetical protein